MAGEVCRSALQRSVAKIFYHAGFEELQPSALDCITDIASDYFQKLVRTFNVYREAEKKPTIGAAAERGARFVPRFTPEEVILHTLDENGHDIDSLEAYARDEVERLGNKLAQIHERMKGHLADLLRPALAPDAGADGSGAFNDGSEQFVTGDFAEELGEDFFGFRALGLDKELGLDMLSVPLHLLQSRVRSQYQLQNQAGAGSAAADLFEPLPPPEPVTKESIMNEIGLVRNFFLAKLHASGDKPLVEDEDLPPKQRKARPRLGATGKIVSPQKRSPKEQMALAKKKKKLEQQQQQQQQQAQQQEQGKGDNKKSAAKTVNLSLPQPAAGQQVNGLTLPSLSAPNPSSQGSEVNGGSIVVNASLSDTQQSGDVTTTQGEKDLEMEMEMELEKAAGDEDGMDDGDMVFETGMMSPESLER